MLSLHLLHSLAVCSHISVFTSRLSSLSLCVYTTTGNSLAKDKGTLKLPKRSYLKWVILDTFRQKISVN